MNKIGRNDPCSCGSGKKYKQCCRLPQPAPTSGTPAPATAQAAQALHAALGYHQSGRLAEAEALYRQVLTQVPANVDALHLLGVLLHHTGRHAHAADLIGQALALQPDFVEARNNLGEVWRALGRLAQAEACFAQALAKKPDYAQAHHNLGLTLHAQDRLAEAIASFQRALTLKPDYPAALLALVRLLQGQGELKKALLCCQRLLHLQPGEDGHWHLYAGILALLSEEALALVEPGLLLQAFNKQALDPQKLERIATAMVCRDPLVQQLLQAGDGQADSARISQALAAGALAPLMEMPLLLAILEEALMTDYRLERLLVLLRQAMLATATREESPPGAQTLERFGCSLALQCFANEYLYPASAAEAQAIDSLASRVAAAIEQQLPCPALWLALLGCYQPLHKFTFAEGLHLAHWPQPHVQALLLRQLIQPLQEEKIKRDLPGLTGVNDAVSQAVRQQYEENPYPRWKRRGSLGTGQSLQAALQRHLPYQQIPGNLPAAPAILVAGCGTGSDAFQVAQAFGNAQILAVDISKTSLAYAQRATQEFGIDHIDFRQADILELGSLDRQFDLIVCSGVLHHMRDPMAGWRVLSGLLRPDGYMNIGLYSRRARHEIAALRQLVANQGYPSTRAGISRFRSDVMRADAPIKIGSIAISPDFYSASACRDLIFHVQEHVFSPLEIQACLDQLGLQFLGFEFTNPETRTPYAVRFPGNPACDSLANWELVEQDNPEIFAGMYQFWVRKQA